MRRDELEHRGECIVRAGCVLLQIERAAEIEPRVDEHRIELCRTPERALRPVEIAALSERRAEIRDDERIAGTRGHRLLQQRDRVFGAAVEKLRKPAESQQFRMIGRRGQRFFQTRFGVGEGAAFERVLARDRELAHTRRQAVESVGQRGRHAAAARAAARYAARPRSPAAITAL